VSARAVVVVVLVLAGAAAAATASCGEPAVGLRLPPMSSAPDAEAGSGYSPSELCPRAPPPAGGTCKDPAGAPAQWACEYGTDPHCATRATCDVYPGARGNASQWSVWPPPASYCTAPPGCPSAFDADAGGACPTDGVCTYPEGRCACGPCASTRYICGAPNDCAADAAADATRWRCEAWLTPAGCPEPRPLLGTPCADEGQVCLYGAIATECALAPLDPPMECLSGVWAPYPGGS
jgi:hypothetical protein